MGDAGRGRRRRRRWGGALPCQECWLTLNNTLAAEKVSLMLKSDAQKHIFKSLLRSCTSVVTETLKVPVRWSLSHYADALTHKDFQ